MSCVMCTRRERERDRFSDLDIGLDIDTHNYTDIVIQIRYLESR